MNCKTSKPLKCSLHFKNYTKFQTFFSLFVKLQLQLQRMLNDMNEKSNDAISEIRGNNGFENDDEFSIKERTVQHIFIIICVLYVISIIILLGEIMLIKFKNRKLRVLIPALFIWEQARFLGLANSALP